MPNRMSAVVACLILLTCLSGAPANALFGGRNSTDAVPWFAAVTITDDGLTRLGMDPAAATPLRNPINRGQCGGALVSPTEVVTAAHCLSGDNGKALPPSAFAIRLGGSALSDRSVREIPVTSIVVDHRFRTTANPADPDPGAASARFDAAVLTLAEPVRAAPIPVSREPIAPNTAVRLYGHGFSSGLPANVYRVDRLQVGDFTTLTRQQATDVWKPASEQPATIYFGDGRIMPTSGDSGGPLVRTVNGRPELVGVFSFSSEVLTDRPGRPGFAAATDASVIAALLS